MNEKALVYRAAYSRFSIAVQTEREAWIAWQEAQKAKQKAEEELVKARENAK